MGHILYATDGSECAGVAAELIAALDLPSDTRVTVLTAAAGTNWLAAPPLGAESVVFPQMAELAAEAETLARQNAEKAAESLKDRGLNVSIRVRTQNPADAILDQAKEDGASLIVMGSHGMGALEHLLLGSVSERVARYAACSVLVARSSRLKKAVLAVDGSESSEHALEALIGLPFPTDLHLSPVHVIRPSDLAPTMPIIPGVTWENVLGQDDAERHSSAERVTRHAADRLKGKYQLDEPDIRFGAAADELIAAAREMTADLLIVGTANRSALGRLFLGSVSSRVLSHAPCSVLVGRAHVR